MTAAPVTTRTLSSARSLLLRIIAFHAECSSAPSNTASMTSMVKVLPPCLNAAQALREDGLGREQQ
jgi:hypothetical protein